MSCADFFWLDVMTEAAWSRHIDTGSQDLDLGTFEPSVQHWKHTSLSSGIGECKPH